MARRLRPAIAALLLLPAVASAADGETTLADAITGGSATAAVRYRYEFVDQDGFDDDAHASTARLRLDYRTAKSRGWSAFAEFDHVFHVVARDFNSGAGTSPGRAAYPVVADPSGSDLNQLYLRYDAGTDWTLRAGRQRILLDNQRFVGNVGWRQNEQTYDALTLATSAVSDTELTYVYVNQVRRIFGDRVGAGKERVDGHLLNARIRLNDDWFAVPYLYHVDYDDVSSSANSTSTFGIRVEGNVEAASGAIRLAAEAATQSDAGNNPVGFDAEYFHADITWARPQDLGFGIGIELLGGNADAGAAFRTPLATLHKFQGWADQFLATPDTGIRDLYASLSYPAGDWTLAAIFHDFSAETGGDDYGTELDLSASWTIDKRYGMLFKAAFFASDSAAFADTTKAWVQFTAAWQ